MTVLHLHESIEIHGGAEVYISELQTQLKKRNIVSFWVGIDKVGDRFRFREASLGLSITGKKTEVIDYLKGFAEKYAVDLINIHSLFDPEIIEACLGLRPVVKSSHSPVMVCPGRDKFWRKSETICDIKYGLHCFWHIYSQGCANRNPKDAVRAYQYVHYEINRATPRYKRIVVMSDYIREGLLECGADPEKIALIPYFTEPVADRMIADRTGELRLLFIGRLVSSKGPHLMLRSLAPILKEKKMLYLDIVGDGLMRKELESMVSEEGLENKVVFHGWKGRDEIPDMISSCYILLFPSIYPEAFGIAGIEAMMHSKPVVAFNVGGVHSWLTSGKTGFLVNRMDTVAFADAVRILLGDSALYDTMSENAYSMARQKFLPARHMDNLVKVYNESLEADL